MPRLRPSRGKLRQDSAPPETKTLPSRKCLSTFPRYEAHRKLPVCQCTFLRVTSGANDMSRVLFLVILIRYGPAECGACTGRIGAEADEDVLPFVTWGPCRWLFRDRRQMLKTVSSLRGRTKQPDYSRRVRPASRLMGRSSMVKFAQPPEDALTQGVTVGPFSSNIVGGGVGGPIDPGGAGPTLRKICAEVRPFAGSAEEKLGFQISALSDVLGGWLVAKTLANVLS